MIKSNVQFRVIVSAKDSPFRTARLLFSLATDQKKFQPLRFRIKTPCGEFRDLILQTLCLKIFSEWTDSYVASTQLWRYSINLFFPTTSVFWFLSLDLNGTQWCNLGSDVNQLSKYKRTLRISGYLAQLRWAVSLLASYTDKPRTYSFPPQFFFDLIRH